MSGVKKRRLAAEPILVPHDIEDSDHRSWLSWRLVPLEHSHGFQAEVIKSAVQLQPKGRQPVTDAAMEEARAMVEAAIGEAQALAEMTVEGQIDADKVANFQAPVAPLVDRYGLIIHPPRQVKGTSSVRIVGPADAARDAAALLWAHLVQGKTTSMVLQVPGQLKKMTAQMTSDFSNDLKALETELKLEVNRYDTMLWIAGSDAESVANAKETLEEMLQFYLPDDFVMLSGLKPSTVDELRQDSGLRALMATSGCAVAFASHEGTAWVCGKDREPVQQRIDAVARGVVSTTDALVDIIEIDEAPQAREDLTQPDTFLKGSVLFGNEPMNVPFVLEDVPDVQYDRLLGSLGAPRHVALKVPKASELPLMMEEAGLSMPMEELLKRPTRPRCHIDDYDDIWEQFEPDLLWPPGEMRQLSWDVLGQFWAGMEEQFAP